MPGARAFSGGRFALELDGVVCGFLEAVSGGAIAAEVLTTPGAGPADEKHLGQVRYEDLELQLDLSFDKAVYDWIKSSWSRRYSRHDGSIVGADFNLKAVSEREFFHALLTEVGFPALDAASKDHVYLTLKLAPELTRFKPGSGKTVKTAAGKQKEWLAANFKLEIDGLETDDGSAGSMR